MSWSKTLENDLQKLDKAIVEYHRKPVEGFTVEEVKEALQITEGAIEILLKSFYECTGVIITRVNLELLGGDKGSLQSVTTHLETKIPH